CFRSGCAARRSGLHHQAGRPCVLQYEQRRSFVSKRPTFMLLPTLVMSIGILVLLSVGSVLIVNWIADRRIVQEYTSRLIARGLSAEERSLRRHLDAAVNGGDFIAAAIAGGRFQFGEPALTDFVSGTLCGGPAGLRCDRMRP